MTVMNGIILRGETLRLVMAETEAKNDTCHRCSLSMVECDALCMRFGGMLGYTRAASARMYFVKG